jgi:hypothetical protein
VDQRSRVWVGRLRRVVEGDSDQKDVPVKVMRVEKMQKVSKRFSPDMNIPWLTSLRNFMGMLGRGDG